MEPHESTRRRPLLKAVAGGAVALGAAAAGARLTLHPGDSKDPRDDLPSLQLSSHGNSTVSALDLRLGDDLLPRVSSGRWASRQLPTSTHSMVGFTWRRAPSGPSIEIRSRSEGVWQPWRRVPELHDLPDPGAGERTDRSGTELIWIGDSDGIQIRVAGARPRDLTLVLLRPSPDRGATDNLAPRRLDLERAPRGEDEPHVPRPTIRSRKDWAADESWRNGKPTYNHTIKQVHIHHTVNSNSYSREDVPGLIRGMYRYHTHNLGWSDIAYNFLVDRFGRIWVGRAGGAARPVRGAHTLGFNATSTGVSVIGNFELAQPSVATLDAIAAVAAWKLDRYGRNPQARVDVVSEGSDKYRADVVARLPVIDGHRDTNDTACPGRHLYDSLPRIRKKTKALMDLHHEQQAVTVTRPATVSGSPMLDGVMAADPGDFSPTDATVGFTWLRNGVAIPGAVASTYRCVPSDVGARLGVLVRLAKSGLRPAVQTSTAPGFVTAPATLSLQPRVRARRVIVHVRVTAPEGVSVPVRGKVVVLVNNRRRNLELVDGAAVGRFGRRVPFRPGRYEVSASYSGSPVFAAAQARTSVRVS